MTEGMWAAFGAIVAALITSISSLLIYLLTQGTLQQLLHGILPSATRLIIPAAVVALAMCCCLGGAIYYNLGAILNMLGIN